MCIYIIYMTVYIYVYMQKRMSLWMPCTFMRVALLVSRRTPVWIYVWAYASTYLRVCVRIRGPVRARCTRSTLMPEESMRGQKENAAYPTCQASYLLLNMKKGVSIESCICGLIKHSHGSLGCFTSHAFIKPPSAPKVRFCMMYGGPRGASALASALACVSGMAHRLGTGDPK